MMVWSRQGPGCSALSLAGKYTLLFFYAFFRPKFALSSLFSADYLIYERTSMSSSALGSGQLIQSTPQDAYLCGPVMTNYSYDVSLIALQRQGYSSPEEAGKRPLPCCPSEFLDVETVLSHPKSFQLNCHDSSFLSLLDNRLGDRVPVFNTLIPNSVSVHHF